MNTEQGTRNDEVVHTSTFDIPCSIFLSLMYGIIAYKKY